MLVARCVRSGLKQAAGRPALATTVWLWNLLLAAVVALPAWVAFGSVFNFSTESDQLLDGFNLRLLIEAFHYDRTPAIGLLAATAMAAMLLGLVGNALIAGGIFEILTTTDDRRFLHRFWRGAGHFFGRFLRLLVMGGVSFLILGIAASIATAPISFLASISNSEAARFWAILLVPAALLVVFGFCTLVLDYARARVALDDSRSAFKAWFTAFAFVVRHLVGAASIGIVFAAIALLVFVLSIWYQTSARSNTGILILLLFLVQQVTMWVNSALRVGAIASTIRFYKVKSAQPGPPLRFEAMAAVAGAPSPSMVDAVAVSVIRPAQGSPSPDAPPRPEAPEAPETPE
jgi:hypothetical protein